MGREEFAREIFELFCKSKKKAETGNEFQSGMAFAYETILKDYFGVSVSYDWVGNRWKMTGGKQ